MLRIILDDARRSAWCVMGGLQGRDGHEPAAGEPDQANELGCGTPGRDGGTLKAGSSGGGAQVRIRGWD